MTSTVVDRFLNHSHKTTISQLFTVAATSGDPVLLTDQLVVSITGVATAIAGVVERHPVLTTDGVAPDPASPNWAPADAVAISGNPSTGMVPLSYFEPGLAWWRFRSTSKTGASVTVAISGTGV